MWSFFDILVLSLVGIGVPVITSIVHNWRIHQRLYSLECTVADLQEKMLSEIKKRAALSPRSKEADTDLLEKIKEAQKQTFQVPWWAAHANQTKG